MKAWRLALATLLLALAGIPLVLPFGEALLEGSVSSGNEQNAPVQDDPAKAASYPAAVLYLAGNTLMLALGALAVALPLGTLLAVLFFRTDLPGRRFFRSATVFALFVPLPVVVSAWQALIGSDGLFPLWFWGANADRPWSAGMFPAIWVHALAGLPWVILIAGIGLSSVEPELEEEALLAAGPWRILWCVTLPRARGALLAAGLWLALQVAADISVTDMLLVSTFAEEVHTQFTMGGAGALARSLMLVLPGLALMWVALLWLVPRLERSLPPLQLSFVRPRLFSLGNGRWLWSAGCLVVGAAVLLVPLTGLVWKVGLAGSPRAWSVAHAARQFLGEARLFGFQVFETLAVALLTGAVTAALALVACWAARDRRSTRILLLSFVTLAWALPAPVVGIGLKETIMALVRWCPVEPITRLLYDGPSPVPILWAHVLRFFPFAAAILWPAVRLVPTELRDAARLEGAGPLQELWHVYWLQTRPARVLALFTVAALSLGEVGAGARVETPGWETFAKLIFDRMHYGADANVAALSLLLLTGIAAAFGIAVLVTRLLNRSMG